MNYEILTKLESQVWVLRKIAPYDDELEKLKSRIYEIRDKFINSKKQNDYGNLESLKNKALELEKNFYVIFEYRKKIIDSQKHILKDLPIQNIELESFDYQFEHVNNPMMLYERFLSNAEKSGYLTSDSINQATKMYDNLQTGNKYHDDAKKWLDKFNKKILKLEEVEKPEIRKLIEELRSFEASMYREGYYLEDFEEEIYNIRNILNSKLTIQNPAVKKEKHIIKFEDEEKFKKQGIVSSLAEEPKIIHKAYNVSQEDYATPQVDKFYDKLRR